MVAKLSKQIPDFYWNQRLIAALGTSRLRAKSWDRSTQIRLSLKRLLISGLSKSRLRIPCISKFRTQTPAKLTQVQCHCPQSTMRSRESTTAKATTASSQVISISLLPNQPTARNVGEVHQTWHTIPPFRIPNQNFVFITHLLHVPLSSSALIWRRLYWWMA